MKLKTKTMLPVIVGVIFIAISLLISANYYFTKNFNNQLNNRIISKQNELNSLLNDISNKSLIIPSVVAEINFVVEAYNKFYETENIEDAINIMLDNNFTKIIQSLQKNSGIEDVRIHFHLPPARSLWRTWTDKRGDDLSSFRNTILRTNNQKVFTQGIEAGVGGAVIRGIVPIIDSNNNHLGSG
jgi:methyl-accepting chemotaxis protein